MQDRNLLWKLAFVAVIIIWGAWAITPVDKQLKGGIDLVGGHSLLYEIDTTGLTDTSGLSAKVMDRLKQRVDPQGVRNLVWRPVGSTRLEIQMPLPPKDAVETRAAYQAAMDELKATNVSVFELEQALAMPASKRESQLKALMRSVEGREEIVPELVRTYDAWQKAITDKMSQTLKEDREKAYEAQLDRMLATNIDITLLNDALGAVQSEREKSLAEIVKKYPSRKAQIANVVIAYDKWSLVKGPLDDPADLMRLLRGAGVLEFHILADASENPEQYSEYVKRLEEKGPRAHPDDEYAWYEIAKQEAIHGGIVREWNGKRYVLAYYQNPMRVLDKSKTGWKLTDAYPSRDETGMPSVGFEFNEIGANYFADLTRNNIDKALAIILDGQAYSAPVIRSTIRERGVITGKFTQEEVNYLVSTLNAGSLDARLKDTPISVNSIGPSLGQDNRTAGFKASMWCLAAVIVFMMIYYLWAGAIADFALMLNLLLLLAMMSTLQATFTMAGIAGIVLSIGMAVDANVLIFERMREEKERLQSLRLIIKNGFSRAMPPIIDSNATTIITCIILYYIGTEEIKGFALTLGLGLVINVFSAVFVTKWIFSLMSEKNIFKTLPMWSIIGRPKINWVSKQRYFWVISIAFIVLALVAWPMRGKGKFDIEFIGGTSVQVELKAPELMNIEGIRSSVKNSGASLAASAAAIRSTQVVQDSESPDRFILTFKDITPNRMQAALVSFIEDRIEKGSLNNIGSNSLAFRLRTGPNEKPSVDLVKSSLESVAKEIESTGKNLSLAQVQSVGTKGTDYEIVTTASAQQLVIDAIIQEMGENLNIQQSLEFDPEIKYYPITKKRLGEVIGDSKAPGYVPNYIGGVAIVVKDISPAVTLNELQDRIDAMRLQPDFQNIQWRSHFDIIGLVPAPGQDLTQLSNEEIKYTSVAEVVMDPNVPYEEDEASWQGQLVDPEIKLLQESMVRSSGLKRVTQFAPSVAGQTSIAAILAIILSFAAITLYIWIRFGTFLHGIVPILAVLHDVMVILGLVLVSAWLADTAIGKALMIEDFKLNLTMVAAFLTLIGYSVNDTIVILDRIRENQGKGQTIKPGLINESINQTFSRTIITSLTVFMVMFILYIFGGEGVHGFSYAMLMGTIVGSYSSVAIAAPMLLGWNGIMRAIGFKKGSDSEPAKI